LVLFDYYLTPKELLIHHRFNKKALEILLNNIVINYKKAIVSPGEMVGMVAAQSIGEPTTQMSNLYQEKMRLIKVSKKNKITELITPKIGEFIDNMIKTYPEYTFNTGHIDSVETLLEKDEYDYYVIGVNKNEETKWNKLSHVSRHPVNGKLIEVKTRSGRKTITTESHSHLIRCSQTQSVVPIKGYNLKVGMQIPSLKNISNKFIQTSIKDNLGIHYTLNNLFGFFIGAYLAEGTINGNNIRITNINEEYSNKCIEFSKINKLEHKINNYLGEYGPGKDTIIKSKSLKNLIETSCKKGSFNKKVPNFAFTAPEEFICGLIQGYMDGDGNIQCSRGHNYIRVCSRSEELIKDLGILFNYIGIFVSFTEENKQNKPLYHLIISNKYASLYKNKIGSITHKEKLDNLVEYTERKAFSLREDIDKIPGLGEIIAFIGKTLNINGHSRKYGRWMKKKSIGRRTLEKYIQEFESNENSRCVYNEINILKQACYSGIVWDEVVEINEYKDYKYKYVYDFTVPETQTFMTNDGIIVHNTLNTFHFAGVSSKSNVTRGVPRIEEILSLSKQPKNPSLTISLRDTEKYDKVKAQQMIHIIEHTCLRDIVNSVSICFDPDNLNTLINEDKDLIEQYREFETMLEEINPDDKDNEEYSKWIIRFELDKEEMLDKNINMDDVHFSIENGYKDQISCVFSDYNSDKLIFRVRILDTQMKKIEGKKSLLQNEQMILDQSDEIYILKNIQENLLNNIILRGVKNISKVILRKIQDSVEFIDGNYENKESWVLDTVGSNLLDILGLDNIDTKNTFTNDIIETYNILGIEAARQTIYNEIADVIEFDGTYINYHHLALLCDRMCYSKNMISIFRHGINNDNIGPIAKASFEETPEMFLRAARHGEMDNMRGVSANVMCGQEGNFGTGSFQLTLDIKDLGKMKSKQLKEKKSIENMFGLQDIEDNDICNLENIKYKTNIATIKPENVGDDNDYEPGF
jgi:DNA-directed RNA polymerase beta' subunit